MNPHITADLLYQAAFAFEAEAKQYFRHWRELPPDLRAATAAFIRHSIARSRQATLAASWHFAEQTGFPATTYTNFAAKRRALVLARKWAHAASSVSLSLPIRSAAFIL